MFSFYLGQGLMGNIINSGIWVRINKLRSGVRVWDIGPSLPNRQNRPDEDMKDVISHINLGSS